MTPARRYPTFSPVMLPLLPVLAISVVAGTAGWLAARVLAQIENRERAEPSSRDGDATGAHDDRLSQRLTRCPACGVYLDAAAARRCRRVACPRRAS